MTQIFVHGSTSPIKNTALQAALLGLANRNILPNDYHQINVRVNSGVPPQPFELPEIENGALNRAQRAGDKRPQAHFQVGIENGIIERTLKDRKVYYDIAVICIIRVSDGKTYQIQSERVLLDTLVCQSYLRDKGRRHKKTFGKYFQEVRDPGINPCDPHSYFTKGKTSRTKILTEALIVVLEQALTEPILH